MTEEVNITDLVPDRTTDDFKLPLIQDSFPNESKLAITAVKVAEAKFGKYAVITLVNKERYRTSATYLVDALDKLALVFPEGKVVNMTLLHKTSKDGNEYYQFGK